MTRRGCALQREVRERFRSVSVRSLTSLPWLSGAGRSVFAGGALGRGCLPSGGERGCICRRQRFSRGGVRGRSAFGRRLQELLRKLVLSTEGVITLPEVYVRNICKKLAQRSRGGRAEALRWHRGGAGRAALLV